MGVYGFHENVQHCLSGWTKVYTPKRKEDGYFLANKMNLGQGAVFDFKETII